MVNRRVRLSLIALVGAMVVASIVYADLAVGTKAPNFTLPTLDGKTFSLSSNFAKSGNAGNVVLLDIWATWCPPCRAGIPYLIGLHKKLKGKNVVIVGVSVDADKSVVADFVKKQGITYTIAHDPRGEKTGDSYQLRTIPATYIIDKSGVIRFVHSGFPRDPQGGKAEAAKLEREITSLLAK